MSDPLSEHQPGDIGSASGGRQLSKEDFTPDGVRAETRMHQRRERRDFLNLSSEFKEEEQEAEDDARSAPSSLHGLGRSRDREDTEGGAPPAEAPTSSASAPIASPPSTQPAAPEAPAKRKIPVGLIMGAFVAGLIMGGIAAVGSMPPAGDPQAQAKITQLQTALQQEQMQAAVLRREITSIQSATDAKSLVPAERLTSLTKVLDVAREELDRTKAALKTAEDRVVSIQDQGKNALRELELLRAQDSSLRSELAEASQSRDEYRKSLGDVREEARASVVRARELASELELKQASLETLTKERAALGTKVETLTREVETLRRSLYGR